VTLPHTLSPLQGAMLRCSCIAQREAARQRREAYTQFAGIFSTEVCTHLPALRPARSPMLRGARPAASRSQREEIRKGALHVQKRAVRAPLGG
jgi:hypothetical protein